MNRFFKGALAASVSLCAVEAHAARVLAVDIVAEGTGNYELINRSGLPGKNFPFYNLYVTAFFPLEGRIAPITSASGVSLGGMGIAPLNVTGALTSAGFSFATSYANFGFAVTRDGSGMACFDNPNPTVIPMGQVAVTPGCGSISVTSLNGFAIERYNFTGSITSLNFREVDGSEYPEITFAIPEPSTWALMLAGFGLTGYALRRRRSRVAFA